MGRNTAGAIPNVPRVLPVERVKGGMVRRERYVQQFWSMGHNQPKQTVRCDDVDLLTDTYAQQFRHCTEGGGCAIVEPPLPKLIARNALEVVRHGSSHLTVSQTHGNGVQTRF
jgi:hypothetical protein